MINQSDVRRLVERSLEKAISLRIDEHPELDPDVVAKASLDEFNKYFEGVYKIDTFKRQNDMVDISVVKDRDSGDGELVNV